MRSPNLKTALYAGLSIVVIVLGIQIFWLLKIPAVEMASFTFWILTAALIIIAVILFIRAFPLFSQKKLSENVQKEFVDNIIHEFKTPVSVMNIAGSVLVSETITAQPERLKKYAGIVHDQAGHLQKKVTRLLEMSVIESKEIIFQKTEVEINSLVEKAITFVQPLTEEKKGTIKFNPGNSIRAIADSTYIVQTIVNLLDNSLKYSEAPSISIETSQTEKNCTITVKDNGIGIEKKYHAEIFKKFFRVPTGDVHNVKGFGIGLNFVKKVIDAHHGRIECKSAPGMGTEMRILLPLS